MKRSTQKHRHSQRNNPLRIPGPATALREILFRPTVTGAVRRAEIVRLLKESESKRIPVNRRYCVIVKRDADFQHMIKHGIGRIIRIHSSRTSARSYFVLNDTPLDRINESVDEDNDI